jgi:O-succinylbenzoate synthase
MLIEAIDLFRVAIPAAKGRTSGAANEAPVLETVLVRIASGGLVGWGEAATGQAPRDSPEWGGGAFTCLRDWLAPALLKQEVDSGAQLQERLAPFQGNPLAKGALDVAWWNLESQRQGVSLARLLGGAPRNIELGFTVSPGAQSDLMTPDISSGEQTFAALQAGFAAGYAQAILKFVPGRDLELLRAVRQAFATEPLALDCDASGHVGLRELFFRLEDFHVTSIEQPLPADDLVGHAMLQDGLRTPICLDQSITSPQRLEHVLDLQSCRLVKIEPGRLGGLTVALEIRAACQQVRVPCLLGSRQQTSIGAAAGLALASLPNFVDPAEYFDPRQHFAGTPLAGAAETQLAEGKRVIAVGQAAASEFSLDETALAPFVLAHVRLE